MQLWPNGPFASDDPRRGDGTNAAGRAAGDAEATAPGNAGRSGLDVALGRIETCLAGRSGNRGCGVVVSRLDRSSSARDALGYEALESLQERVAERLTSTTRVGESPIRLPDGALALVIGDLRAMRDLDILAERMISAMRAPLVATDGSAHQATVSVGLAASFDGRTSASELLDAAGRARSCAEAGGGNRAMIASGDHALDARARYQLEQDLRAALEGGQFVVQYQPIVDLDRRRLRGFEALVRWDHPVRRLLHPGSFLTEAVELGIGDELDQFVLDTACAQARTWSDASPVELPISVNVDRRRLLADDLVEDVAATLDRHGLAPSMLRLEVPERTLALGGEALASGLRRVSLTGVGLSIDNGTGDLDAIENVTAVGSLSSYKLDRCLVANAAADSRLRAVVRLVAQSAPEATVVAQGLEVDAQILLASGAGIESGQGFGIQRPLAPERLEPIVAQGHAAAPGPSPVRWRSSAR